MQAILQFCLIAILLEGAFSDGVCYDNYACVEMTINNLKIPDDNPAIKAEKDQTSHSWYMYVNWLDKPAGNLSFKEDKDEKYTARTIGNLNVYEQGKITPFAWAELARKALGLNNPHVKIPGKVRVNRYLFSGDKCMGINFDKPWPTTRNYYVFLHVTDDDDKTYLKGYLLMNK